MWLLVGWGVLILAGAALGVYIYRTGFHYGEDSKELDMHRGNSEERDRARRINEHARRMWEEYHNK